MGEIIVKLSPSWKDSSKRMIHKSEDYSLDDLSKHLRIEGETRNKDKKGKVGSSVHHVSSGGSSQKGKSGFKNKKGLAPKNNSSRSPTISITTTNRRKPESVMSAERLITMQRNAP